MVSELRKLVHRKNEPEYCCGQLVPELKYSNFLIVSATSLDQFLALLFGWIYVIWTKKISVNWEIKTKKKIQNL